MFIIPLSLFASQAGDCSVLCAVMFDELRPKGKRVNTRLFGRNAGVILSVCSALTLMALEVTVDTKT